MTQRKQQRLRQIVGRDTRVIHAFLGIIERYEDRLLTGHNRRRVDESALDRLTMTALRVTVGRKKRLTVPHDFKARFPRMSVNELTECRQAAVAPYQSYLELRAKRGRKASRPCRHHSSRRIPRWVFSRRFRLFHQKSAIGNWRLDLCDSLDSARERRRVHDRLVIPLKVSPFHHKQLRKGDIKALQVFTDRERKWWVTFAVRLQEQELPDDHLPPAVLGIDLGINKAACTTLITPEKVRETRYFVQRDKVAIIRKYDQLVAQLQNEMDTRQNIGQQYDNVARKLRDLKSKRENIAREYDRFLVRQILDYILHLSEKYCLYVALGRLRNIRQAARRGNYRGRRFRGMIHSWAFARITDSIKHQLAQRGWSVEGKGSRFQAVPEVWTSIKCWKCGVIGARPRQNYFSCPSCGHKTNADRNGAINIAGRLITLTSSLHGVRGLGKWASAVNAARSKRPKTSRSQSKRKSLLSSKDQVSGLGESAAVHQAQTSLLDLGDEAEKGDDDPAVVRTVESLSAVGNDTPMSRQENEARSDGGTMSQ